MRPTGSDSRKPTVTPPKNAADLPRYLRELLGGFFTRFAYIFRLVWETGPWILIVKTLIALFEGITPVIGALLTKYIINGLQLSVQNGGQGDMGAFFASPVFALLIFFFLWQILKRVVGTLSNFVTRIAGELVIRTVKLRIMEKAKTLDMASFDDPEFYERLENANREAAVRPITVISQTFSVVSSVIELASYIVVLATAPGMWWTVPAIIVVSVPSAIINFIYRRRHADYIRRRSVDRRRMNYCSDILVNKDMVKEIRMFDLGDTFIERYRQVFAHYFKGLLRLIRDESLWHTAIAILSGAINLFLYFAVAAQVFAGRILLGDYTLYTGAILSVSGCVSSLISLSATVYEGTLFIDNLIYFMKEKTTVVPSLPAPLTVGRDTPHTFVFEHVSFRYPGTQTDVLHDINFTIRPAETMVLVGLNGAGKTTLLKLLTRLYDPTEGRILLDGHDLRAYDLKSLYSMFGIIFQDFGRYAVSVEDNIRFGDIRKTADRAVVRRAAEQSDADSFISRLPEGYDTPLMRIFEVNGTELSTGQWQKLAVARAFYADADVLILDEPTASLDPMAEQEIFDQFDRLRAGKTTVFVSHRLSSATTASMIVVLEQGQIVEMGTHADLMKMGGKYCRLFSTQARRYTHTDPTDTPSETMPD